EAEAERLDEVQALEGRAGLGVVLGAERVPPGRRPVRAPVGVVDAAALAQQPDEVGATDALFLSLGGHGWLRVPCRGKARPAASTGGEDRRAGRGGSAGGAAS